MSDETLELKNRPRIGVMGPSACSNRVSRLAREVGFLIGREGAILICGGGRGVMEAAAGGAKEAGGITVGILPGASDSEANPNIDIPIVTDMGNARNVINVLTSQAIIAVHGGYGTLAEIALARKCGRPVVGLKSWSLIPPDEGATTDVVSVQTPQEAVAGALRLIGRLPKQR